jgi:glyoxylase-like metal-dependent hydrolase (beta-lactamase superfamily II)
MKNNIIVAFILMFTIRAIGQEIKVSDKLKLIKLTDQTYIHTCQNNNGVIYISNKEALIVSTPDSDSETQNLIDWVRKEQNAKIVGYVIDRWHPDAMEGLDIVIQNGIKTYSYELTRQIAKQKGLPVPEIGFDPKTEIAVGKNRIICHFLGEAHTSDGIVVWIPNENILFGGNGIRSYNGWVGNIGDANLDKWSETARRIKDEYGSAKIVIPGHGEYGGTELIDYTINLYKSSKWGEILRSHDIKPELVFNDYDDFFEIAKSDSVNNGTRFLHNAVVFVHDSARYFKIESPLILHQPDKKRIDSEYGRLWIYDTSTGKDYIKTDIYYKKLIIFKRDDSVGFRIIIKEMIN